MTDEQFKQLMDKLEEIKRAQQPPQYIGHFPQPQPWDHRQNDQLPLHWSHYGPRD